MSCWFVIARTFMMKAIEARVMNRHAYSYYSEVGMFIDFGG